MLIDCPACARSYHVRPTDIEGGRTVICPRCDARWFVGELSAMPALGAPAFGAQPIDPPPAADWPLPAGPRRLGLRVPRGVTLGLASLALVSATIGARARIMQIVPRSAALYAAAGLSTNSRGLDFRGVDVSRTDPASPLVTISGEIRNVAGRRVRVPRIVFEIRDGAGQSLVRWSERAPARLIAAGRTLAFASAPHQIPAESRSAAVHFESDDPS